MKIDTYIKSKSGFRAVTVALAAAVILMAAVPAAQAALTDPFTPQLSVPSDAFDFGPPFQTPTAYPHRAAGGHPDLVIGMRKPINQCPELGGEQRCTANEIYIEQDLKKQVVHLPPGLLADANAAPYCEPYQEWVLDFVIGRHAPDWFCDEGSVVGAVEVDAQACRRMPDMDPDEEGSGRCLSSVLDPLEYEILLRNFPGAVFNARPRTEGPYAGEQGHLVVLVPSTVLAYEEELPEGVGLGGWVRSDISIRVRDGDNGDFGIDAVADMIPDLVDHSTENPDGSPGLLFDIPVQIARLDMALYGATGAGMGHPLITNPTFCEPQSVDALFQGYARNSYDPPFNEGVDPDVETPWIPGSGEGNIETDSAPYQATDCGAVPYAPTFAASADTEAPGATPALSTVIAQADDEATTKKVQVTFPKGMGVNINSSLTPCSAADLAAKSCPEASKMGTVTAESRLLPKRAILGDSVKPEDEVLAGNVYLTGLEGNKLSLSLLLTGFIDLRLDATAGVSEDGTLTATFDDLPTLPYDRFTLNLFGGEKSLLQNPRRCGIQKTTATFTSHSGKVHTTESASEIKGCNEPTFDAELTEPSKGKRTGLNLEVRSDAKPIKEVKFGIDRYMKLSTRGLGKKRKFGEVSATSAAGTEEAALKRPVGVKQKKGKAFSLRTSALKGLGVNIYRKRFTRKGIKTFKRARNKKKKILKKKTVIKNRLSVKQLPSDDLTKVAVSLNPDETKLLRNHTDGKICHARFIAIVKTEDGTKYALKQKLRLRGKGCGKKKSSKKKARKK